MLAADCPHQLLLPPHDSRRSRCMTLTTGFFFDSYPHYYLRRRRVIHRTVIIPTNLFVRVRVHVRPIVIFEQSFVSLVRDDMEHSKTSTVTCVAPVNIAVIKYWGKRDDELILPINDSISASLDVEQLCAKTTVMASPDFENDCIWLNGRQVSIDNKRLQNCLAEAKKRGASSKETKSWKVHICSVNNFPTAAGLASSAAGYACLSVALAKLFKYEGDVSGLARIGSGSACRSIYGGFVRWYMGKEATGADSVAKQIVPSSYWPEMRILILVTNENKKAVSSAIAMKRGVETSEFLKYRAKSIVPKRVEEMERAIIEKNFVRFAELTMKDSNSFHAVALDTFPPCHYLNDASRAIIDFVHAYNRAIGQIKIAYTNDAGPNTVLYLLEEDVPPVIAVFQHFFPPLPAATAADNYLRGEKIIPAELTQNYLKNISFSVQPAGLLKYIIHSRVGDGPKFLDEPNQHLLDNKGFPIQLL